MTRSAQIKAWIRQLDAIKTALITGPFSPEASRAVELADDMTAQLMEWLEAVGKC